MATETNEAPKLPPVWFKHLFWRVHRFLYRRARQPRAVDPGEQARAGGDAPDDRSGGSPAIGAP